MITCPECGQAAPDDAKFCDRCGQGLAKSAAPKVEYALRRWSRAPWCAANFGSSR